LNLAVHKLSLSLSGLTEMLDTEAATSCQMSEATTEKGIQQNEQSSKGHQEKLVLNCQSNHLPMQRTILHFSASDSATWQTLTRVVNFCVVFYCFVILSSYSKIEAIEYKEKEKEYKLAKEKEKQQRISKCIKIKAELLEKKSNQGIPKNDKKMQ